MADGICPAAKPRALLGRVAVAGFAVAIVVACLLGGMAYTRVFRPMSEQRQFEALCANCGSVVVNGRKGVFELTGQDAKEFLRILSNCTSPFDRVYQNAGPTMRIDIFKDDGSFVANVLLTPAGRADVGVRVYEFLDSLSAMGRQLSETDNARVYGPHPDCRGCIERTYYE